MAHFSLKEKGQEEVRSLIHRLRAYRLVRNLLIGFILVAICNLLFSSLFFTPKMFRLADEKRELKLKYEILQSRIRSSQRQIEQIRHRDYLFTVIGSDGRRVTQVRIEYAPLEDNTEDDELDD